MADALVKSSADWLGSLLVDEIKCMDAIKSKVDKLQTELDALAAFLTVAVKSRTRRHDEGVQIELEEARNIAYDCEDVIDTYICRVGRHGYDECGGWQFGTVLRWGYLVENAWPIHETRTKIDRLNERISALKDRMKSYGVSDRINHSYEDGGSSNSTHRLPNQVPLNRFYTHEGEGLAVVGLKEHLDELSRVAMDSTNATVIAICGMGGVGKSTLARELYHHSKLRGTSDDSFKAFGWATASRQFQPDRVLTTLMYSLVSENDQERRKKIDDDIKADRAHRALYDLMREFKCLVVIDDVWSSNDWASIQAAFPKNNVVGSKIVLTTRNQETISALDPTMVYVHPIHGLDVDRSLDLFWKNVSPAGVAPQDSRAKVELGSKMLQHCKGIPLAIVVLGKALRTKEREQDWEHMHDEINKQIERGDTPKLYKDVYDVLQVSYDELPYYLQQCFLYLANFPEDHEISSEKLYQLWVDEGVLAKEKSYEPEESVAERYLNELVSRNMVEVATRVHGTETIKTCRLHDLMRDVCIDISNREGFFQAIRYQNITSEDKYIGRHLMDTVEKDKRLRRLTLCIKITSRQKEKEEEEEDVLKTITTMVMSSLDPLSANESNAPNLRSLTLFSESTQEGVELDCKSLFESFSEDYPLLRVFDCQNVTLAGVLPKKVENMIHLRHLGLANTRVTELPVAIENLQSLQTLDLRIDGYLPLIIPNILWKMKRLRHIYFPDDGGVVGKTTFARPRYIIKGGDESLRIDGLSNLQTILHIDLDRVDEDHLSDWPRLKTLKASSTRNTKALHSFLQCSKVQRFELNLHAQILNEEPEILSKSKAMFELYIYTQPKEKFRLSKHLYLEMLPKYLVSLGIWYVQLDYDPFPVLEKLSNLVNLRLFECFERHTMICSAGGFPQLASLCLYKLRKFNYWEIERGSLCKLRSVVIVDCPMRKISSNLPSSVVVKHLRRV